MKVVDTLKDLGVNGIITYLQERCCENMDWTQCGLEWEYKVGSCEISGCAKCGIYFISSSRRI